jgi:hypothetical protein
VRLFSILRSIAMGEAWHQLHSTHDGRMAAGKMWRAFELTDRNDQEPRLHRIEGANPI